MVFLNLISQLAGHICGIDAHYHHIIHQFGAAHKLVGEDVTEHMEISIRITKGFRVENQVPVSIYLQLVEHSENKS